MKNYLFLSFLALLTSLACSKFAEESFEYDHSQYADSVIDLSSEFSSFPGPWSSLVILGSPDTYPEYGDLQTAWTSKDSDRGMEYISVGFDTAQYVHTIKIYETYNPGSIELVYLRDASNKEWVPVYSQDAETDVEDRSRVFQVKINETDHLVDGLKVVLNTSAVAGWNEIDAVEIIGSVQ